MKRISTRSLVLLAAAASFVAACGGDDAATTATTTGSPSTSAEPSTTEPATPVAASETDAVPATTEAQATDETITDDTVVVAGLEEMPEECVRLMGDLLEMVEPYVEDVDLGAMTGEEFESLMGRIEAETDVTQVDAEITDAGCANYSFADDAAEGEALIEIAEDRAPGAVAWVEFITSQRSEAPDAGTGAPAVDAPADCAAAVAFVDDLLKAGETIATMTLDESATLGQVFTVISEDCTPEEAQAFFARPDVTAFLGS